MKQAALMMLVMGLAAAGASAQKRVIRGVVTDSLGTPIPGVQVMIDGRETPRVTNEKGYYRLKINGEADTIGFRSSLADMHKEAIKGRKRINYTFPVSVSSLPGKTVHIGYGEQSRDKVTGSVFPVDARKVNYAGYTDVWQALAGQVPGLEVVRTGEGVTLRIRGHSSNRDSEPLILLNGVRIHDLNTVNPHDVESIDVIKDGTAAIYGIQGANGVILITTYRAR
ncbi:MAG: TonB-dependent receptor plug domain-containing protein [Bacteroidales bacterium]